MVPQRDDAPAPSPHPPAGRRILFLDDDPERAAAFLALYPHALWVQSAAECIGRLEAGWDEVHLDHDLGGEAYVDMDREDCGMEVVRWLCQAPRPHLLAARFVVHTHNSLASCVMVLHLHATGYRVEVRPFSSDLLRDQASGGTGFWKRLVRRIGRGFGRSIIGL